jgi:hypothetical protein
LDDHGRHADRVLTSAQDLMSANLGGAELSRLQARHPGHLSPRTLMLQHHTAQLGVQRAFILRQLAFDPQATGQ